MIAKVKIIFKKKMNDVTPVFYKNIAIIFIHELENDCRTFKTPFSLITLFKQFLFTFKSLHYNSVI